MSKQCRFARINLLAFLIAVAISICGPAPCRSARAPVSPAQREVLVRIDSLWESSAGITAHDYIAREVERARVSADSLFLMNLICREGRLLAALNRSIEAEPVLREGMDLAASLNESLHYRFCLHWLGVAFIGRGRLQDASECFDKLLRLSKQAGDSYHEGYAWMGLAYDDWQHDKAKDAREKYARSVGIFRELGQFHGELWALMGLNNVLTVLGEYEEALAGNRRIAALGKKCGSREIEAQGHNNLGVLLFSIGDTGEALDHFRRAAELQELNGNTRESLIAWQNACICGVVIGRTREASQRLRDLLKTSSENGYVDVQASLQTELGYAHLQRGDYHEAARLFRGALDLREGLTPAQESEALTGLSRATARAGSTRAALDLLREQSDRMLALADPRLQLAYRNELAERLLDERHSREAFALAMSVEKRGGDLGLTALRLGALPLAARAALALDEPDSALALLRRGVQLWESARGLPLDPEWREQRGAAAKMLFTELTWLKLTHPPERSREERIREAFDTLQAYKARTLLERMMGPGGQSVPAVRAPRVTLAELQTRILRRGELLLDFSFGPERSLLFACTAGECRALTLPGERELNDKLRMFHTILAARPSENARPGDLDAIVGTARNLTDLLFASCADMIAGARHLVVVPDGALNLLPPTCLLEDRTVSEVPAAAVLAWLRDAEGLGGRGHRPPRRILALAARYAERGESLPGAAREIGDLKRRFAGVTTRLPRVSPESLADFDIIHFAAHSTADDQSPWRSAIHLGVKPDGTDAYMLRASEIAGWKLPVQFVVLSSCASAQGRILSGEGVQGLTAAFLSAGAPAVLATLWPVDDRVTTAFMSSLYEALQKGETVSAAVVQAQNAVRAKTRTAHPFYWSGFVLIGDGDLRLDLPPNRGVKGLWWTAALLPVIIAVAIALWRKKILALR